MRQAVSIIIPMYNEEMRIPKTVQIMNAWIDAHPFDEVLFSDDGSEDNTIEQIMNLRKHGQMRIMESGYNFGKWNAIRKAFFMCKSPYVVLLDADLSVDPKYIDEYGASLEPNCLVLGNRYGKYKSKVPPARFILSRGFNLLERLIVGLRLPDTQVPFKMMERSPKMAQVFVELEERKFAGDVELIRRAQLKGIKMSSVDVQYEFKEGSTVLFKKHAWPMFRALWAIRKIR
jgi:glycosyltransferase involved in cell wall biosynthesis